MHYETTAASGTTATAIALLRRRPSWIAGLEVLLFSSAMFALVWKVWLFLPGPVDLRATIRIGAALLMLATLCLSITRTWQGLSSLGMSAEGLRAGWSSVGFGTLLGAVVLLGLGSIWGEPSTSLLRRQWLGPYLIGVIGQQVALQVLLNDRFHELAAWHGARDGKWFSVLASTALFAAFHVPNFWLVAVTSVAGMFWTFHFRRYRNFPALVVSHLVLGSCAMLALGEGPLMHLRVGWGAMKLFLRN